VEYFASFVPLRRDSIVLCQDGSGVSTLVIKDSFSLLERLQPGDKLWQMMGSTNSNIALAAFRKGVEVYEISYPRIRSWLQKNGNSARQGITPEDVRKVAQEQPSLFYPLLPAQSEILEIITAWEALSEIMRKRIDFSNTLRHLILREVIISGEYEGRKINSKEELEIFLTELLVGIRDEEGRKLPPRDPVLASLLKQEERARRNLKRICERSNFYQQVFGDVEGVGPILAARFISAIVRIERFKKPTDLSNYAGMLPRGREGKLPSKKRSKGEFLSRSPELNNASFLFQEVIYRWGGVNTPLGQMLRELIHQECPFTPEERAKNEELKRRYREAVKKAKIRVTRYFLEEIIWPRWKVYVESSS
jgi:hypothetical protein